MAQGAQARAAALLAQSQGGQQLNTAFIERLNATFRSRLAPLGRRTRALARRDETLQAGMYLIGSVYNFCTDHQSLRVPGIIGGRHKWLPRTPAGPTFQSRDGPDRQVVHMTTVYCGATEL
jgi:hypothetical protein